MKQLLSAVVLMLFAAINTFGQCPNTNSGTFCPTFNSAGLTLNTITEFCEMVPGDYQEISNLVAGNTYRISFCNAGSNNPPPTDYNSFMTVYGPGGFVTFNDDFCGTNSQVEFVAPASGTYRVLCNISGNCSATSFSITPATITLVNAPSSSATVSSITRASANPTNAGSVNYTVTFSGSVSGLTASNFSLTTTGGISGASVGTPTGSGTTWTVPVNTGSGDGTIRLDLVNATGLSPSVTTPYTSGQVYDIDKTGPGIVIGAPSANAASCGSVTYTVTYTGASTISLANSNITLNTTGNASAGVVVSGSGTSTRTVTLNNFTGTGTLGISIAANTATDAVGNNAATAGPSATFTVSPPPSATISYSGSPYCNSGTANVTLSGSSGGAFSSASGLSINSASGEVNLATSTPGAYTVTYTIAASGGCAQFQTSANITITANPSATISYSGSPYCNSGTTSVTLSGSSGGAFSSTSGLTINSSSGEVNLATSTPGAYTVTYTITASGGCAQFQTTANITINAAPSATISYSGSPYCNSGTANVTLSGSSGGSFSSASGLSINSASGEVNLAASTPGAYTVTYTIAASGGCAQFQTSANITINAAPSATISYSGSPYCNSGTATVILTGTANGSFASTNGLSLNSSSGELNLAASTPGSYTVTYTIAASGGCSQVMTTTPILINPLPTVMMSTNSLCQNTTLTLLPTAGGTWNSSNPTIASINNAGLVIGHTPGVVNFTFTETATGCSSTTTDLIVKPTPSSALSANKVDVCPNTEVTLEANCSIPTATVNWIAGAPTVIPDAATIPYLYKASCTFEGCTGNESGVEVRTHRILVAMKELDAGPLPRPIIRSVIENMGPIHQIQVPISPRRWTFIATGCSGSESAVFKLSGPISLNTIDNNPPYALFANVGDTFFSAEHPNYGTGGNFTNGSYTLTVALRTGDGAGGPFPKNRVATGNLSATRTLQFTIATTGLRTGTAEEATPLEEAWVAIYPNPVPEKIAVQLMGTIGETVQLSLINGQGQLFKQKNFQLTETKEVETMNIAAFPAGLYFLKVTKGEKVKTLKVFKVN